jgi:hypothetical protein
MENRAHRGDSSTGSELKAVEEACREASRTVEPLNDWNVLNKFFGNTVSDVPNVTRQKVAVGAWHRFS